jgi:hypothetical protein
MSNQTEHTKHWINQFNQTKVELEEYLAQPDLEPNERLRAQVHLDAANSQIQVLERELAAPEPERQALTEWVTAQLPVLTDDQIRYVEYQQERIIDLETYTNALESLCKRNKSDADDAS